MASKWLRCDLRVSEARVLLCSGGRRGRVCSWEYVKIAFLILDLFFRPPNGGFLCLPEARTKLSPLPIKQGLLCVWPFLDFSFDWSN